MPEKKIVKQKNIPYNGKIIFPESDQEPCTLIVPSDPEKENSKKEHIEISLSFLKDVLLLEPGQETEKVNGIKAVRLRQATHQIEKPKDVNFYICNSDGKTIRMEFPRKKLREHLKRYPSLEEEV